MGLISERILKPLWKCNDTLFENIIGLFQKFNLTYRVYLSKEYATPQTFYFFPHLKNAKFPKENSIHSKHISLKFILTYFFPQFFLQRLALFWHESSKDIAIYEDGFKAELLTKGIHLHVTYRNAERPNKEELEICVYSGSIDDSWSAIPAILQSVSTMLSNYWKFYGDTEVYVMCPKCIAKPSTAQPNWCNLAIRLSTMKFAVKMPFAVRLAAVLFQ